MTPGGPRSVHVDPAVLAARLNSLQAKARIRQPELAKRADLSLRTIQDMMRGRRNSYLRDTLISVGAVLGADIDELLGTETGPLPRLGEYVEFYEHARAVDKYLVKVIRDHRTATPEILHSEYGDLLLARLSEMHTTPAKLTGQLCAPATHKALASHLPVPDLAIEVLRPFKKAVFHLDGSSLALKSPTLLWDCHCRTPDVTNSARWKPKPFGAVPPCPIHSSPLGRDITARFMSGNVVIRWNDLTFHWKNEPEFWPPSIDAFLMAEALVTSGATALACERVLDLGCGTGFLGIVFASMNPNVTHLDLADWLLTPLLYSLANASLDLHDRRRVAVRPLLGLDLDWIGSHLGNRAYDVVLCNPPISQSYPASRPSRPAPLSLAPTC